MKFERISSANMSALRGYVSTSYPELVEIFGKPNYGPNNYDMDKTTCEWILKFENGVVVTIYDYRTARTPYGPYEWHIGGYDDEAVAIVQEMINLHRDPLVRMLRDYTPSQ